MGLVGKAKDFAMIYHATQKYGKMPYTYHLDCVVNVLADCGYANDEAIVAAGWLHDTLEDTNATYKTLVSCFGYEVSAIVFAVTNEPGQNRDERLRNTAPKILANKKALIVKLADRIANTESSLKTNPRFYKMYLEEFPLFKSLLYRQRDVKVLPLWSRLSQLYSVQSP